MTDLPLAHKIVERPQSLLQRCVAIPSMHLVEIDVIGLQPPETVLNFAHDVHAGCPAMVKILAHWEAEFGGKHDLVPHTLQGVPHQSLALAEAVHVRASYEIDSPIQARLHHPRCVFLTEVAHVHLAAELHRAKRQLTHDEYGIPQFPIPHRPSSFRCNPELR